jgi:hypothetical protein
VFLYEIITEIIQLDHKVYILYSEHPRCDGSSTVKHLVGLAPSLFARVGCHTNETLLGEAHLDVYILVGKKGS